MAMTRLEMQEDVRENIKRQAAAFSNTKIQRRLDWAQNSVCDTYTFEEMRKIFTAPTVASQKRYGFATRMKDIYDLTLQDGDTSRKLVYIPARDADAAIPRPETLTEERPKWYIDHGKNFELIYIPNAVYTLQLRCSVYVADLDTDSSESELLRKDRLIIARATELCFASMKEPELAKYWKEEEYKEALAEAIETDHSAEDWTPIARGFSTKPVYVPEYVSNPLVGLR